MVLFRDIVPTNPVHRMLHLMSKFFAPVPEMKNDRKLTPAGVKLLRDDFRFNTLATIYRRDLMECYLLQTIIRH